MYRSRNRSNRTESTCRRAHTSHHPQPTNPTTQLKQYFKARSKELAATKGRKAKESVACHAHDILDSFPELNTDARLAGWRVKQPAAAGAGAAGGDAEHEAAAAAEAEEPVLVDTHKQGHLPAVGDVVEYALPPHLLLDDGRCVLLSHSSCVLSIDRCGLIDRSLLTAMQVGVCI
jgi:hypothetical protein